MLGLSALLTALTTESTALVTALTAPFGLTGEVLDSVGLPGLGVPNSWGARLTVTCGRTEDAVRSGAGAEVGAAVASVAGVGPGVAAAEH